MFVFKGPARSIMLWLTVALIVYLIPSISFSIWWFALAWVMNQWFMLTMSVGNHRLFAHKTFKVARPLEYLFAISTVIAGDGSAYSWAYIHRAHHRLSDTPADPYVRDLRYMTSTKKWSKYEEPLGLAAFLKDPLQYITHKYAILIIIAFASCLALISKEALFYGFLIPVLWHHVTGFLLIKYTHKNYGKEWWEGEAVDRPWYFGIPFPAMGEWYHKYHHSVPRPNCKNETEKWYEVDLGYYICKLIAKGGVVR